MINESISMDMGILIRVSKGVTKIVVAKNNFKRGCNLKSVNLKKKPNNRTHIKLKIID